MSLKRSNSTKKVAESLLCGIHWWSTRFHWVLGLKLEVTELSDCFRVSEPHCYDWKDLVLIVWLTLGQLEYCSPPENWCRSIAAHIVCQVKWHRQFPAHGNKCRKCFSRGRMTPCFWEDSSFFCQSHFDGLDVAWEFSLLTVVTGFYFIDSCWWHAHPRMEMLEICLEFWNLQIRKVAETMDWFIGWWCRRCPFPCCCSL